VRHDLDPMGFHLSPGLAKLALGNAGVGIRDLPRLQCGSGILDMPGY
jgi:hypothetical protein